MRRAVFWGVIAGFVAILAAFFRPDDRALVLDAYLLFAGGLALMVLARATGRSLPARRSAFAGALAPAGRRHARPESLAALERLVLLSTETSFELHFRLRPLLRAIAAHRLAARHGVELDDDPEAARGLLGPEAWELVRPDRPPPADRLGAGMPLGDLRAVVTSLERI